MYLYVLILARKLILLNIMYLYIVRHLFLGSAGGPAPTYTMHDDDIPICRSHDYYYSQVETTHLHVLYFDTIYLHMINIS